MKDEEGNVVITVEDIQSAETIINDNNGEKEYCVSIKFTDEGKEIMAEKYKTGVTLLCDTNHILSSNYSEVIVVGARADAVDYKLISIWHKGDTVVTQDYGVAAMALGKGAYAIHQSGKWYTNENIDQMLMEWYLNKKARRGSHKNHSKGHTMPSGHWFCADWSGSGEPKKRTEEDDKRFVKSFDMLVLMACI